MDSNYNRTYYTATTFFWALFATACLNHLTHIVVPVSVTGAVEIVDIKEFVLNKQFKSDQATVEFKLSYDLSNEYGWNFSQIYLSVVAEYSTDKKSRNQVTLYDQILDSKEKLVASEVTIVNEYPLRDQYKGTLLDNEIQLVIYYQRFPVFGLLTGGIEIARSSEAYKLPSSYHQKNKQKQVKADL
jgi:Signal peptidase subunit